jgi:hypothetical protein
MNPYVFLPVAGLAMWLGAIYIDSKFSYRSPSDCNVRLKDDAAWWKKLIVGRNTGVRYGALFSIWGLMSVDVYLFRAIGRSDLHYAAYAGVLLSIAVYMAAQGWRFFVKDSDRAH